MPNSPLSIEDYSLITNAYKILTNEKTRAKYDDRCLELQNQLNFGGKAFKISSLIM